MPETRLHKEISTGSLRHQWRIPSLQRPRNQPEWYSRNVWWDMMPLVYKNHFLNNVSYGEDVRWRTCMRSVSLLWALLHMPCHQYQVTQIYINHGNETYDLCHLSSILAFERMFCQKKPYSGLVYLTVTTWSSKHLYSLISFHPIDHFRNVLILMDVYGWWRAMSFTCRFFKCDFYCWYSICTHWLLLGRASLRQALWVSRTTFC